MHNYSSVDIWAYVSESHKSTHLIKVRDMGTYNATTWNNQTNCNIFWLRKLLHTKYIVMEKHDICNQSREEMIPVTKKYRQDMIWKDLNNLKMTHPKLELGEFTAPSSFLQSIFTNSFCMWRKCPLINFAWHITCKIYFLTN